MKQKPIKHHFFRNMMRILLLAVICIGSTELFVCRYEDPMLFKTITDPVCNTVIPVYQAGKSTLRSFWDTIYTNITVSNMGTEKDTNEIAGTPTTISSDNPEDSSITALVVQDDKKILTGGIINIIYYNQTEEPWASSAYGSDKIGGYGCGPTSMAMVISSMTDSQIDPAQMANWAVQYGYWAAGNGSYPALIPNSAKSFGLKAESYSNLTPDSIRQELAAGNLFVALMTAGHFTNNGHFIVLRGVTLDGKILVADPSSLDRSLISWDAQLILNELSHGHNSGAPLWLISAIDNTIS